MRVLFSILFLYSSICVIGQQTQKPISYKKSDYPSSRFLIKNDTSLFGQVQIITIMTSPKGNSTYSFLCRSWLIIKKNDKVLKQKYYDIEPVGGCSGLYISNTQPLKNLFIASKFGDYEGQTLLIDTTGKITELSGGSFSISQDGNYLFTIWDSDLSGITIYDLKNNKIILEKESAGEERFYEFYFQEGKYYISLDEESKSKTTVVGHVDLATKKIFLLKKPYGFLKKANKLKVFNEVQNLEKCNCGHK